MTKRTPDRPPAEVDDEPRLKFGDTLPQQLEPLYEISLRVMPPVHRRQGKVGAVAVRGVRDRAERAEVVDPV